MEQTRRRRRRRKNYAQQRLIKMLILLVVVLTVVVTVAVSTHKAGEEKPDNTLQETPGQTTQGTENTPGETDGTQTTEPPTAPQETTIPVDELGPEPDHGEYVNVGTGYIAEVITFSAETFNGQTSDDYSAPIRNYLPEGTVDYASTDVVSNSSMSYMLLRCGRRVYTEKNNWPSTKKVQVVNCYQGTLPDHNEIGFVSVEQEDHFTVLTLDVLWKAPFYFNIEPQTYLDPSHRDYRVSEFTAEYIDITFCYATSFEGTVKLGDGNPLFKYAQVFQGENDCTLRLYLKETGGFYGYDSYYNENDQLCFKFLNPVSATHTDANSYGADLTGIRILIDVGHGGVDGGSVTTNADGKRVDESSLNLALAKAVQKELESMGATVILNRTDDTTINTDDRVKNLKEVWPDIAIAIHQNAYPQDTSYGGFQMCYSTPFSHDLAELMYDHTVKTGIYDTAFSSWHYYFVARQTNCPMVLMENGYMTNAEDLANMQSSTVLLQKAQAMAKAVAEYFLSEG